MFSFNISAPPPPPSDPLLRRLYNIRDSYDSNSKSFRFKAIFYDTKGSGIGGSSQAPACLTADQWSQAQASAPGDEYKPNVLCDFKDLEKRISAQEAIIQKMRNKLDDMRARISELKDEFIEEVETQLKIVEEKNIKIDQLLMGILEVEEISALQSIQFTSDEHQMLNQLEELKVEIDKPNKYVAALNTIKLKSNLLRESMAVKKEIRVDDKTLNSTTEILKMYTNALKSLVQITKKMKSSANNMKKMVDEI